MNQHVQNYVTYDDYLVGKLGQVQFAVREDAKLYWPKESVSWAVLGELGGAGLVFYDQFKIVMKRPGLLLAEINYYVFKRDDAPKLAHALSLEYPGSAIDLYARSRVLARFMDGQVLDGVHSLSEFYSDVSEEELEETLVVWPAEESGQ